MHFNGPVPDLHMSSETKSEVLLHKERFTQINIYEICWILLPDFTVIIGRVFIFMCLFTWNKATKSDKAPAVLFTRCFKCY